MTRDIEHLQERSRRSAEAILDAAVHVLTRDGIANFTMASVAEVAGGSVGGVYGRYSNKGHLLLAVKDRVLGRLEDELEAAVVTQSEVTDVVTTFVGTVSASFFSAARLFSFVVVHSTTDPAFKERGFSFHVRARATLVAALDRCGIHDVDAVHLAYEMIMQSLLMRVISLGNVGSDQQPYPGFPSVDAYGSFLAGAATDALTRAAD